MILRSDHRYKVLTRDCFNSVVPANFASYPPFIYKKNIKEIQNIKWCLILKMNILSLCLFPKMILGTYVTRLQL